VIAEKRGIVMKRHEEIVSLMQTLGAGFRLYPEETEKKLDVLTEVQQENLIRLLKKIAHGNVQTYAFGHGSPEKKPAKPDDRVIWDRGPTPSGPRKAPRLPEPDAYDEIDERSAICRGCPSGCELRWDDKGNFSGYSCIIGQETAEMLAEYYRAR
jgi:hypothetical protein